MMSAGTGTHIRRDARGAAGGGGRGMGAGLTRILLVVAFVGSLAFIGWGILQRGENQVAILVAGLLVLALTLASLALAGLIGAYRAGREGRGARAFWNALLGGIAGLAAWGCLAAAVVLALLYT